MTAEANTGRNDQLTARQRKVLDTLVAVVGRLLKLNDASLRRMRDYVMEHGTDHEDGSRVDALVTEVLELARDTELGVACVTRRT